MGSSASAPPPPDTSRFTGAQMNLAARSRQFAERMFQYGQQQQQFLQGISQQFLNYTMPAMEEQFDWARTMRERYETEVMPQVRSLFQEAETYASKAEEDRQRGMAIQDVKSASEAQRESQLRKLESYGIDPSQTRYMALDKQARTAEAALSALAANQAGERTKEIGRNLRREAIATGTGFLGEATGGYGMGTNIGGAGVNAATGTARTGAGVGQAAYPYMAQSSAGISSAAGNVHQDYQNQLDYAADQRAAEASLGGLGQLIGTGIGAYFGVPPAAIPGAATGGEIEAPGGPHDDAGIIRVSDGEYVIPADVVNKMGANVLDKFVSKQTGDAEPTPKQALPVGAAA